MEKQLTKTTGQPVALTVAGRSLTLLQVCDLAARSAGISIRTDSDLLARMEASALLVEQAVDQNQTVYGVTTGFGGMAGVAISRELAADSQNNLMFFLATGAGPAIERRHVRAAMLLRANVLARGCSGVRPEIVHRLLRFLEADATPIVRELGSIGASGDLVPLATIARAITGQTDFVKVQIGDRTVDGAAALRTARIQALEIVAQGGIGDRQRDFVLVRDRGKLRF